MAAASRRPPRTWRQTTRFDSELRDRRAVWRAGRRPPGGGLRGRARAGGACRTVHAVRLGARGPRDGGRRPGDAGAESEPACRLIGPNALARSRTVLTDAFGRVQPAWSALLTEYPDRFLIGCDLFVPQHFRAEYVQDTVGYYRGLLGQLDTAIAEQIAFRNAERLAPFPCAPMSTGRRTAAPGRGW